MAPRTSINFARPTQIARQNFRHHRRKHQDILVGLMLLLSVFLKLPRIFSYNLGDLIAGQVEKWFKP